jgi:protease-4
LALGLIDGLGSTGFVAREIIKAEDIKNYSFKPNYLDRIAKTLGTFISDQVISEIKLL